MRDYDNDPTLCETTDVTVIRVIDHDKQRYNTVGDYQDYPENVNIPGFKGRTITVSQMSSPDFGFLVALHEFIEEYLCRKRGISNEVIDEWDKVWEANAAATGFEGEPGACVDAPYFKEHQFASLIEKQMANELGIDWSLYSQEIERLSQSYRKGI